MEVQGVSCTTCTKKQSVIMAYLYRKNRSPFWYIQYVDSDRKKHDKSTGFRADDPNDTVKAKILRAELETKEYQRVPVVNGAAWDTWVPKFLARHCETRETFVRYEDAWKWIARSGCNASEYMLRDNSPTGLGSSTWTGVPISRSEPARRSEEIPPSSN